MATPEHNRDVGRIGQAILDYIEENDLCSEADDWIDNVNRGLTVKLPTRGKEYEFTITVATEGRITPEQADEIMSELDSLLADVEHLDRFSVNVEYNEV